MNDVDFARDVELAEDLLRDVVEPCARCCKMTELEEFVSNLGVCDECFEIGCPCQEGQPDICPLHEGKVAA